MTTIQHTLACYIVRENFGDLAKDVAKLLIRKTSYPFAEIVNDLKLSEKLVSLKLEFHNLMLICDLRLRKSSQFSSIMSWCNIN